MKAIEDGDNGSNVNTFRRILLLSQLHVTLNESIVRAPVETLRHRTHGEDRIVDEVMVERGSGRNIVAEEGDEDLCQRGATNVALLDMFY